MNDNALFTHKLLQWYASYKRDLPWRNSRDPYKIWLSEIILQQTRVNQGLPYYQEFTKKYPVVHDLAEADEQEVLRTWQGLGYYSRARNLHKCARIISKEMNGRFPENYSELLKLPGIGPYTASAIASFAFDKPHPVVDGNVYRVISRAFGVTDDITSSGGQKKFREIAGDLLDPDQPGEFNQAIMEFGALHCLPANPLCDTCFFRNACYARQHNAQNELPVKKKKSAVKKRYLNYVVIRSGRHLCMRPRTSRDIWQGLYDFPLVESKAPLAEEEMLEYMTEVAPVPGNAVIESISDEYVHVLSHQRLYARFYLIDFNQVPAAFSDSSVRPFTPEEIQDLPKPVLISRYLNDYIF